MNRKEEILHQQISEAWNNSHRQADGPVAFSDRQRLICNWTNSESGRGGNKARTMGVKKGISDWVYMDTYGKVIWIELKTDEGGQSREQILFEALCNRYGHSYYICRSYSQFWNILGIPEPFPIDKLLTK